MSVVFPIPPPDPADGVPGSHIPGWMSAPELLWLHETAKGMKSIAEIGSLCGRSSYALLSGCPGDVYCVDPWDDDRDWCYQEFVDNVGSFPNLRTVRGGSPGIVASLPEVDMTFIDGDHEYESVMADIAALTGKTRRLICGHDYHTFPGVTRAVDESFGAAVRVPPDTWIWVVELG